MYQVINKKNATMAAQKLSVDRTLAPVIKRAGLCDIEPHGEYYHALVDSIIGQQLSVKAATNIRERFQKLFDSPFPKPEAILDKSIEELRSAGLSRQKASYIHDLAQHVVDGKITFSQLDSLSNDEVVRELSDVKGIGEWTVHMFLMFCMGRLDILAYGDLGIRTGIKKLYQLEQMPTPQEVKNLALQKQWHPYETIACWYIWYSLDNKPV